MASEDKHPISEHATSKKNPILEMNQRINEQNNRGSIKGSFRMKQSEVDGMQRVLDSAAKFKPYKK